MNDIAQGITQAADRIVALQKADAEALALLQSRGVYIDFPDKNGRDGYISYDREECAMYDLPGEWLAVIRTYDHQLRTYRYSREGFYSLAEAVQSIVGRL